MDWETSLLCLGLVVGSALLVFIISTLGTRGQSYEEVVAANRRLVAQRGLLDDPVKQKKLQQQQSKKNKKAGKKVKEKQAKEQAAASNSEVDSEAFAESGVEEESVPQHHHHKGHVEFVEAAIVTPDEPPKPTKNKKKVKDAKVKPILINKDDPSCISDTSTPPSPTINQPANHFEQIHPKDEFELLHSVESEKVESKVKDVKTKSSKAPKTVPKQEKEKIIKPVTEPVVQPEPPKEQRKNKRNAQVSENSDIVEKPQEELIHIPSIPISQPADMTTDKILKQAYQLEIHHSNGTIPEVQQIKSAQPSQNAPPLPPKSKKKKNEMAQYQQLITCPEGVNVNLLVRLLGEASLSRSEIQILTDCLLNKQNGPLPEHSEWSEGPKDPLIRLKKQLAEKEKAFTAEQEASQALQAKLKELRVNLNTERIRCTQINVAKEEAANILKAEAAALQSRIQRGIDENNSLRQQVHQLQAKVASEAEWSSQRTQMEMRLQTLSEQNAVLTNNMASLNNEYAELQKAHALTSNELSVAHEYKRQFEEAKNSYAEIEQQVMQKLAQANERLQGLSEAQSEIQRLNSAQSHHQQQVAQHEKRQEELDKQNQQLLLEINKLKTEKDDLSSKITELKEQIASQPTPNGTTSPDKNETVDVEKAIADACSVLEEKHSQQLDNLQRQLDQHRDKNNELRTKNWKVMEACQAAEKKLQQLESQKTTEDSTLREAVTKACLEEQRTTKDVLERLFPQVSVQGKTHKEWLDTFTEKANNFLIETSSKAKTAPTITVSPTQDLVNNERLKELENKNHQLQCLVDKYKGVVVDTEKTLSRLQDNVSEEEQKWKTQLNEKQIEVDNLKQSIVQMKTDATSLQIALDCEKKLRQDTETNENDSLSATRLNKSVGLGDIEKLTEENTRLKELVEKLQNSSQTQNGPSQDGYVEI